VAAARERGLPQVAGLPESSYNQIGSLPRFRFGIATKWASRPLFLLAATSDETRGARILEMQIAGSSEPPVSRLASSQPAGKPSGERGKLGEELADAGRDSSRRAAKRRTAGDRASGRKAKGGAPGGKAGGRGEGRQSPRSPVATALTPEIETELAGIAAGSGCELLHAEWKGGVLRLILDRSAEPTANVANVANLAKAAEDAGGADDTAPQASSGVSLGDCEHVAKQASALLDVLDFGGGRYVLEVSSPGLDRQLYRASDYRRFLGRLARVTYEATGAEGRTVRRTIVARLSEFHAPPPANAGQGGSAGAVTLTDERTGERLTLRLESIRLARLEVEL
jgi:ribosome maturation factor RimP